MILVLESIVEKNKEEVWINLNLIQVYKKLKNEIESVDDDARYRLRYEAMVQTKHKTVPKKIKLIAT